MKAWVLVASLLSMPALAAPMDSRWFHFYWGAGPNLTPGANIRLGLGPLEFGLVQGSGFGTVWVQRSDSLAFFQVGAVFPDDPALLAGGGLEWRLGSYFRLRADVSVTTNLNSETMSFVSVGGVLVL
jgi:hypothetical protein